MAFTPYTWIFALATITAFVECYGIGANDLANAFGTSVGAKALKYWQAVVVASIFEFLGAILLGANNTETMKAGVANVAAFKQRPELLMYGMLCTMIVGAFWDIFSCTLELQVSTTHTTAGALIGMSLTTYGSSAVIWYQHTDSFPYMKGVAKLFLGWVTSPILASAAASIIFFLLRTFVMRSRNSWVRALYVMPLAVGVTIFVVVFTVIQTGNSNGTWATVPNGKIAWISVVICCGCGAVAALIFFPVMRRHIAQLEDEKEAEAAAAAENGGDKGGDKGEGVNGESPGAGDSKTMKRSESSNSIVRTMSRTVTAVRDSKPAKFISKTRVWKMITYGINFDVHGALDENNNRYNETAVAIHDNAEVFDYRAEAVFKYIQVFSACVMSFAHGANDVANAMGPYSAVLYIWQNSAVPGSKVNVPSWVLAYGGAGIVVGLATYGWHIMGLYAVKSVKVTNVRGFSIELATSLVVIVAARFGIPVSTSHICVFAAVAVGCFEGRRGVNWKMVLQTIVAMFITLGTAMGLCSGLTAWGVYSPMKNLFDATGYPGGNYPAPK